MSKKEIIVIASGFNTPRIKKRISHLKKNYSVKLIYFTRKNDNPELVSSTLKLVNSSKKIGVIENKKYFKRILIYLRLLIFLLSLNNKKYYIFGSDFQLFVLLLKGNKYIEIGDLRVVDMTGVSKKIFTWIDKITLKKIDKLIVTSEHHYKDYYNAFISFEKVIIVRNKLEKNDCLTTVNRKTTNISEKINIGLFGMLRYEIPIDFLIRFIKKNNQNFKLTIYGITVGKYTNSYLESLNFENNNIDWKGSYLYPDDLEKIYNEININFVVYDSQFKNVQKAIPNKLYESSLFNRPILAATNTEFGKEIIKQKIGKQINIDSFDKFEKSMLEITIEQINNWSNTMSNIKLEDIFEDDQYLNQI